MNGVTIRNSLYAFNNEIALRKAKSGVAVFVQLPVIHMNNGESFICLMAEWSDAVLKPEEYMFHAKARPVVDDDTYFFPFTRTFVATFNPSDVCFISLKWFELNTTSKSAVNYEDLVLSNQKERLCEEIHRLANSDDPLDDGATVTFRRNLKV